MNNKRQQYRIMIKQQGECKGEVGQQQDDYKGERRLINSQQLTPDMAVNYLFQWRSNDKLLTALLSKIYSFFKGGSYNHLPTTIFIMSLTHNLLLQRFCQKLAKQSLICYLLLRWSYSAYLIDKTQQYKTKLDNSIFSKNISDDINSLEKEMKIKELKLNYAIILNDYYERLFHMPQRLKKYNKEDRNDKMRERLHKINNKFFNGKEEMYLKGILLPLEKKSCVAVRFIADYCCTFSTKDRVPFKIVYETISQEDMLTFQGQYDQLESSREINKLQQQSDIKIYNTKAVKQTCLTLPHSYFGPEWRLQKQKMAYLSPYRHLKSYQIQSFIIKSGDDIRQEYMAMQLITMVQQICKKQNIKIWLRTYSVIPFDQNSGLIEFVDDTRTVSYLKQKSKQKTLRQVYKQIFGSNWESSISNFVQSLAGYSLIQYIFQIKDRHNNNILIDNCGHIIHIDFSFIISSSPGNMNFEKAPFKLTKDYIELMEGEDSDIFKHFKLLLFFGLKYIRKYKRQILDMVLIMTHCKNMKCFQKFEQIQFEKRFSQNSTDQQLQKHVEAIVKDAITSYTTGQYDTYQWLTNQIYN